MEIRRDKYLDLKHPKYAQESEKLKIYSEKLGSLK